MIVVTENYGADADGNRGEERLFYELENTEQEREEIALALYDSFLAGEVQGLEEIEYHGVVIEVEISDYLDELVALDQIN